MTAADRPRVSVTPQTCAGTGICAFYATTTFDLDDDGKVHLLAGAADPIEDVRNAMDACPTRSIRLDS